MEHVNLYLLKEKWKYHSYHLVIKLAFLERKNRLPINPTSSKFYYAIKLERIIQQFSNPTHTKSIQNIITFCISMQRKKKKDYDITTTNKNNNNCEEKFFLKKKKFTTHRTQPQYKIIITKLRETESQIILKGRR